MLVGYARVSTLDQNLDLQRDALTKAGCERLFVQIARILKINELKVITDDIVEAARSTLVIGAT